MFYLTVCNPPATFLTASFLNLALGGSFLVSGKLRLIRLVYQVYLYGFFSIAHIIGNRKCINHAFKAEWEVKDFKI